MSKHRRRVIAGMCGIVASLILGAGALSYGYHSSLPASAIVSDDIPVASRTSVDAAARVRRRSFQPSHAAQPTVTDAVDASAPSGASAPETPAATPEECARTVPVAMEIRDLILPIIPHRPVDMLVRSTIEAAFNDYFLPCAAYIDQMRQSAADEIQPDAPVTDIDRDHCAAFTGKRRMNCIGALRDNILYR